MANPFDYILGIGSLIKNIGDAVDRIFTSDEERGNIEIEKEKLRIKKLLVELSAQHKQLEINMAQANHPSMFVAGARPAIMWIGAVGLAYEALVRPIGSWFMTKDLNLEKLLGGAEQLKAASPEKIAAVIEASGFPSMNTELFMPIVLGILGIGGVRTWEKMHGVARNNMSYNVNVPVPGEGGVTSSANNSEIAPTTAEAKSGNAAIEEFNSHSKKDGYEPEFPGAGGGAGYR